MKEGDLVICISNDFFKTALTVGKQYRVLPVPESDSFVLNPHSSLIHILSDTGTINSFINNRFILDIQGMRDEKINNLING